MSDPELRDRVTRLETFTGLDDTEGGLRGDMRQMRKDIGTLYERMRAMELRGYMAAGGFVVVVWLISHFAGR